jgi:hypothetical protein
MSNEKDNPAQGEFSFNKGGKSTLPRLLRYALASPIERPAIRQRLVTDVAAAAADLREIGAAWLAHPEGLSASLGAALDIRAGAEKQIEFATLAACVRLLGIPDASQFAADHCGVAAALAATIEQHRSGISAEARARLEAALIGWSLVASGAFEPRGGLAIEVAELHALSRIQWIEEAVLRREEDRRREEEAAQEAEEAEDGDDVAKGEPNEPLARSGFIPVCSIDNDAVKSKKLADIVVGHTHVINHALPLATTPDIVAVRKQLVFEFPYAEGVIDRILQDLIGRPTIRLRPTVLVGRPGGGKSRFARRLGELLGVGAWRFDASQIDGAVFAGTARRWASAEVCHPFLAISRARVANPLVLIDEVEKSGTRSDYGRLWDSLLGFLEPETAVCYPDPALQTNVDLSHVSYVATANALDPLPAPLRDRLRVVEFPVPRAEHLDALLPSVVADYSRQQGFDSRWITPLSATDRELLASHWTGGSVRRLQRLVEAILRERERTTPRQ